MISQKYFLDRIDKIGRDEKDNMGAVYAEKGEPTVRPYVKKWILIFIL